MLYLESISLQNTGTNMFSYYAVGFLYSKKANLHFMHSLILRNLYVML